MAKRRAPRKRRPVRDALPARRRLGYVPEDRRIFTGLTVAENLRAAGPLLSVLREVGCHEVQGYCVSPPQPLPGLVRASQ